MKKTITFLLAFGALVSTAQFNNTYDVNANTDYLFPSFCITTYDKASVSVSFGMDAPSTPRTDYFIITKHDENGNVIFNRRIDPSSAPNDGITHVEALLETKDKGILIAGYIYDISTFIEQPILVKVDAGGNLMWTKIYYVNNDPIVASHINKISLSPVYDDDKENYFIVASSNSDARPVNDVSTNVIKVDVNGDMIWSKKYFDVNLATSPYAVTRDYPGDIEFSPADKMYMITGWRQQWVFFQEDRMFFFGIDKDGNVMTYFKTITAEGYPFDQDMIYDPNNNVFAVSFTHGNSGFIPGVASGIGLVTIDASLNIYLSKFYWHAEGLENYGRSISLCNNGDYVIGCFVYEDSPLSKRNPAWLKVDNAGNPLGFMRYNIGDDVIFGHHAVTSNPVTGNEEYVLIGEHNTDLRVIRTEANGKACGAIEYKPLAKDFNYVEELFKYYPKEIGQYQKYEPKEIKIEPKYRKCEDPGTSYRGLDGATVTGIGQHSDYGASFSAYPSILSFNASNLIIENNSVLDLKLEIRTITGQLVFVSEDIRNGKNTVDVNNTGVLSEGVYLTQLVSSGGSVVYTGKLLITK